MLFVLLFFPSRSASTLSPIFSFALVLRRTTVHDDFTTTFNKFVLLLLLRVVGCTDRARVVSMQEVPICMCVCVYLGVDRASRLLVIVIICATGCALMFPPHSSCAHAYDVHAPLSSPLESSSGTPVCPFRCSGGGGSGEGQIVYVYLLTSLTCWCSLVNVLRVKHLLFFPHPPTSPLSVSLAHDLLLLLPFSPPHYCCPYTPPPIVALSSSSSWCIILGLSSPRHRMRISPLRPRTRASILLSCVCCPRETCPGGKKNPVPLLRNTLVVCKFLSSTLMRDMYNMYTYVRVCTNSLLLYDCVSNVIRCYTNVFFLLTRNTHNNNNMFTDRYFRTERNSVVYLFRRKSPYILWCQSPFSFRQIGGYCRWSSRKRRLGDSTFKR